MRGANRRRTGASSSASIASTSTKREREEESASAADESSDGEVSFYSSDLLARIRGALTRVRWLPQEVPSSSASESESESGGEDAERERELERALADVPFGELQRARADGSLARATSAAKAAAEKKARRASKRRFGDAQAPAAVAFSWVLLFSVAIVPNGFACVFNRPMEISTKVRPPKLREVIQVPKKVSCVQFVT
jgi:ribosomal RNA-processing protein 36